MLRNAKWIWQKENDLVNSYVDFYCEFSAEATENITLYISADSHYMAYVNGVVIDGTQYADYPQYKVYDTHDISNVVKVGKNTLCILGYCVNETNAIYLRELPGCFFRYVTEKTY